jgi:hypothetical protein
LNCANLSDANEVKRNIDLDATDDKTESSIENVIKYSIKYVLRGAT